MTSTVDATNAWSQVESRLLHDPCRRLNTAEEACSRWAAEPSRVALSVCEADGSVRHWTYAELDRLAARCAQVFASAGLVHGDRIAAVLSRQVESLIVALAAWRSGLIYVPLYCGFGADALVYRITTAGAGAVVVDHRWLETFTIARNQIDYDLRVYTVDGKPGPDQDLWAEIDHADADGPAADTTATDLATLMFTSGTSGRPKACEMPHGGLLSLVPFAWHTLGVGHETNELLFTTADPGWSYGLYTTGVVPMSLGVRRVIYTGDFDPVAWHRVMSAEGVTAITAAPSAYRRLTPEFAVRGVPGALQVASAAGEPLPAVTAADWEATGAPPIHDGYGLSEVGMPLGDLAVPESGTKPGSIAGPIPGFTVTLVNAEGEPVAEGEAGRIAVRRPPYQLSQGYENVPEQWAERWVGDHFVTEDIAAIGSDGRWRFVGRADDMIITSGMNVSPIEVETVLLEQAGVSEAAAVAAEDPVRGIVVRAVVVADTTAPDRDAHREQLRAAVKARVARHAAPRIIDFVDMLPRTEVGKLRRAALRSET